MLNWWTPPTPVFSLPALTPTQIYAGPSIGVGTPCRCNTVYYSTLNACALCQGAGIDTYAFFAEGIAHKTNSPLDGLITTRIVRPCIPSCEIGTLFPVTSDDHRIFSRFPSPIPSGFSVPHWAYLDVTVCKESFLYKYLNSHVYLGCQYVWCCTGASCRYFLCSHSLSPTSYRYRWFRFHRPPSSNRFNNSKYTPIIIQKEE